MKKQVTKEVFYARRKNDLMSIKETIRSVEVSYRADLSFIYHEPDMRRYLEADIDKAERYLWKLRWIYICKWLSGIEGIFLRSKNNGKTSRDIRRKSGKTQKRT